MIPETSRRSFIKQAVTVTTASVIGAQMGGNPAPAAEEPPKPPAPAETLPMGKICNLQVSRLILGGNQLTGACHCRDLAFAQRLQVHYNTAEKILETLALAEQLGINTLSVNRHGWAQKILADHRKRGGKMQWILHAMIAWDDSMKNYEEEVRELAGDGTNALYVWGCHSDDMLRRGRMDLLAKAVEIGKKQGVPMGVGCHNLDVVVECEKLKVPCDFYIKTFHHHRYPSAPKPGEAKAVTTEVPGYWCNDPERHIEVMKTVTKPWIAFKVMAAGSIRPANAFRYAYENGADHILAGMFDFDLAEDVKIAKAALNDVNRARAWRS
jgi:hypothetical protein